MNADDIARLQAAELHEQDSRDQFPITVEHTYDSGIWLESRHHRAQIASHYYTGKPALGIASPVHALELDRVDELIALLQRAREIIKDGV